LEVTAEVLAVAIQCNQLTQRRQAALQLPAHLAVLAEEQYFMRTLR
jgi:hypothetical protein